MPRECQTSDCCFILLYWIINYVHMRYTFVVNMQDVKGFLPGKWNSCMRAVVYQTFTSYWCILLPHTVVGRPMTGHASKIATSF